MMTAGQRLYPDTEIAIGPGFVLRYQGDGHLVCYGPRGWVPWQSNTFTARPGYTELQHDGNLTSYDANGAPYYASDTNGVDPRIIFKDGRLQMLGLSMLWQPDVTTAPPPPDPGVGAVRQIVGRVKRVGNSFGDGSGPRILHGCSDFAALVKFKQDRDTGLRTLDTISAHQQYVRVLWRLNGWHWSGQGSYQSADLSVDPIRDGWFDEVLRDYLTACDDRGIRVNLSTGDMNNWTQSQAEDGFTRVAQIAASVSEDLVWLAAAANEMRSTMHGGDESAANIALCEHLMRVWERHYPWSLRAISDPGSQDKAGMQRLSGGNANVALIHDVRWETEDAIRRTFNTRYENFPGDPIAQDEGTGPNGSPPHGPFTRKVYQPIEDHDDLLAIYTMQVITGQASTYFNDPALVSREPLDSTWGFKELPAIWRELDIPEDIGQGDVIPGHKSNAPLQVVGSNASRADSMALGSYCIGVISGGQNWRVKSGRDGQATARTAAGVVWEGRVSTGEVLPIAGPTPTIVRIVGGA